MAATTRGPAATGTPAAPEPAITTSRLALWIAVFVIGVFGGYLGYRAVEDQPASNAAPPAPVAGPLPIIGVRDYDPEGDQAENPEQVEAIRDGNPATTWSTELYKDRDVGGLKSGVGLVIDVGTPKHIDRVEVVSPDSDWSARVYTSDSVPSTLAGWGPPGFDGQGLGPDAVLTLAQRTRASNVLLWITNLPPARPFRLRVAEVRVVGTS